MKSSVVGRSLAADVLANPQTEREASAASALRYWRDEALRLRGLLGLDKSKKQSLHDFYWVGVVRVFVVAMGDYGARAEDAQHRMWKAKFLPNKLKSTTHLSHEDLKLYIERCIQDAAEQGLVIYWPSELQDL